MKHAKQNLHFLPPTRPPFEAFSVALDLALGKVRPLSPKTSGHFGPLPTLDVVLPHIFRAILVFFCHFLPFCPSFFWKLSSFCTRFQSTLVSFSHFWSVLVKFGQFQAGHTRQKHTNFLPTGKWGETRPNQAPRAIIAGRFK